MKTDIAVDTLCQGHPTTHSRFLNSVRSNESREVPAYAVLRSVLLDTEY